MTIYNEKPFSESSLSPGHDSLVDLNKEKKSFLEK